MLRHIFWLHTVSSGVKIKMINGAIPPTQLIQINCKNWSQMIEVIKHYTQKYFIIIKKEKQWNQLEINRMYTIM